MHAGRVVISAASGLLLLGQLAGCAQERPRATSAGELAGEVTGEVTEEVTVELTESGACGDAFFWAASETGDMAVTVAVGVRDRSTTEPTTVRFAVPDPAVAVDVLSGRDLARNFCTDLPDPTADPVGTLKATAGTGVITVGPQVAEAVACGHVRGTLSIDGLVAEDGAVFAPVRITTDSIGCYSG